MTNLEQILVHPTHTIRMAMTAIDRGAKGIALVVDEERHLLGTVTDGDIRRAILAGDSLDTPVSELLARKADTAYPQPITARLTAPPEELLKTMRQYKIRQLPLLDEQGRVVDLVALEDLLPEETLPVQAVIMAGGFGKRLRPITEEVPKPMLPIGDRPLMELIIEQLRQAGIRRASVMTHYLAEKIISHFGDGSEFGIDISYVTEDRPLGTAGALGLMEPPQEPLLVINGDILTRVDFRAMLAYHREQGADLTVGVRQYDLQVPYGVVECQGPRVCGLREKPQLSFLVNAGIYLLEPTVHQYIPYSQRFDMTDLIEKLLAEGRTVVAFPIVEYWVDIGQLEDYEKAQEDVKSGRFVQSSQIVL